MTKYKQPAFGELPEVVDEYMGNGNTPPVEGGRFPVLQLSDGGRHVGKQDQSFESLRKDAIDKGIIAAPEKSAPKKAKK